MPERIYKLQPDRTLYLRGFDSFAAAASIHSASPTGFQISGTFRDPADFAVAVLYDVDNNFEHPSIRYLPDFDFSGITLSFNLLYQDTVQPIDSPKFNWIDWATLDCIRADGSTANIPLWDYAMLVDASFPAASATLNVVSANGVQSGNRITLWHQNLAFDYTVPAGAQTLGLSFFAGTTGAVHSITIDGRIYSHTEAAGENSANQATVLAAAINAGDPEVSAAASANTVILSVRSGGSGNSIAISASDGNAPSTMYASSPQVVAAQMAKLINGADWVGANAMYALVASANGTALTVTAARYGKVNVQGTAVTWVSGTKFSGLTPGSPFCLGNVAYQVASVQSPVALTLNTSGGTVNGVQYLAPRGGRDGNMIQLYTLAGSPSNLNFDQSRVTLSGGSSAVTWNVSLDFTALGIDQLRQCWLTFAPSLTNGTVFNTIEWQAAFSNWQLSDTKGNSALKAIGPGSQRIEENSGACQFTGNWTVQAGYYSAYFSKASATVNDTVTVTYYCQFTHSLYLGTSIYGATTPNPANTQWVLVNDTHYNPSLNGGFYSDRGVAGISLDGDAETLLDCRMNTGSELVTRRLLRTNVPAGRHTVTVRVAEANFVYFDFLDVAVPGDVRDSTPARTNISPALDFDTDQTYKVSPARLMWMFDKLGYAGPMNEYLGVFWWNQRKPVGASFSTGQVTFNGTFAAGDTVFLKFDPAGLTTLGKSVFPGDNAQTIAAHFAGYINGTLTGSWASATGNVLTITGRSPGSPYNLTLSTTVTSAQGTAPVTLIQPAGVYPEWVIDDMVSPPINRAVTDWHADYYALCAARLREVTTSCSLELVNPPAGYAALFPDAAGTPVTTATGFGTLNSTQCAVGGSKMVAYQKTVYRNIAQLQTAAGLTPNIQFGEFLWWFYSSNSGMGYYDPETTAAAQTALGRPLHVFLTPNDDPSINGGADATFLRNRLRDHVAALASDIRSAYPSVKCELLFPYDVNYPKPVPDVNPLEGGQLNRFLNLPLEWQTQATSGLDRVKVEALAFGSSMRNLDLARQAVNLFLSFGWNRSAIRYLVPVFGSATPWVTELGMVWSAGLPVANLWALDHVCLYNLDAPERPLPRRSVVKSS